MTKSQSVVFASGIINVDIFMSANMSGERIKCELSIWGLWQ